MYTFFIPELKEDELTLEFPPDHHEKNDDGRKTSGCIAAEALLRHQYRFKEKIDYTLHNPSGVYSGWTKRIKVKGKANIIKALEFFLNEAEDFNFNPTYRGYSVTFDEKAQWKSRLNRLLMQAVDEKTLLVHESEAIHPFLISKLDRAYNDLKADVSSRNIEITIQQNLSTNYLLHPFYQLLAACWKTQCLKQKEYDNKSFFKRIGKSEPEAFAQKLANKYYEQGLIPNSLTRAVNNSRVVYLDALTKVTTNMDVSLSSNNSIKK